MSKRQREVVAVAIEQMRKARTWNELTKRAVIASGEAGVAAYSSDPATEKYGHRALDVIERTLMKHARRDCQKR